MIEKVALKIPQILNAALAACVIICVAQRTPEIFSDRGPSSLEEWLAAAFGFFTIFAWNLKNYIDEYRGFESRNITGFSLARTVIFGSLAYFFLACAAANLGNLKIQQGFIAAFFFLLVTWSICSALQRRNMVQSAENTVRLKQRYFWIFAYFICGISVVLLGSGGFFKLLLCSVIVLVVYVSDVITSGTFRNEHNGIV